MERHDRSAVVTLFCGQPLVEGELRLGDAQAQHARVRRVEPGDSLRLLDGQGHVAVARALSVAKKNVTVIVEKVNDVARPSPLEVIVPVADRDRMLLAAEKLAELQVTAWRPAYFARSRSVTPRGEGDKFHEKVRARMWSALEQSGSAWMPELLEERDAPAVMEAFSPDWNRLLLDGSGAPLLSLARDAPTVLAIGPEGGFERGELQTAYNAGWVPASLGPTTLRFETAAIMGAAVIRAAQHSARRA